MNKPIFKWITSLALKLNLALDPTLLIFCPKAEDSVPLSRQLVRLQQCLIA